MALRRAMGCIMLSSSIAMVACGKRDAATRADSSASAATAAAATSPDSAWVAELGQMLVVPSDSENAAVILFPASPSPRLVSSRVITLLNAAGDSAVTRLAMTPADSQLCGDAPIVHIRGAVRSPWSVGLLGRAVSPVRMDSIEALSPADSARLAAELARLASTLHTSPDSRFAGLPFVVLAARHMVDRGREIVVAHLVRRVNQEAAPLEEHTFLIAERPASAGNDAPYAVHHSLRSEGSEENAEHFDVLSAVRGTESLLLLIARDQDARTHYEVLERSSDGAWRTRWTRTLSC
jgi:hypothetical protein